MITKERFTELLEQDGLNKQCADSLWSDWYQVYVEFPMFPDSLHEEMIHKTNLEMGSTAPQSLLLHPVS